MSKIVKEFTVESWISGEPFESVFRISLTAAESEDPTEGISLPESISRLKKLQKQYFEVIEQSKSLEEQLYNSQMQIRALQVSNIYFPDMPKAKSPLFNRNILEQLEETKDESIENLKKETYLQKKVIEDLMCKLQNMHNKIEYFKENVSELKHLYNKEKTHPPAPPQININSPVTLEQYQYAQDAIIDLNEEVKKLKHLLEETNKKKSLDINNAEDIRVKIAYNSSLLEKKYSDELERYKNRYMAQLLMMQQKNSGALESLAATMKQRVDSLKNSYEFRIVAMIKEFSFEEAMFQSKICLLSQQITENFSTISELEQKVLVYEEKLKVGKSNQSSVRSVIRNLQTVLDAISLEKNVIERKSKLEAERLMEKIEDVKSEMKHGFAFQAKMAEKDHQDALEALKKQYEMKIDKINLDFQEEQKRIQARDKTEFVILMNELTRLEQEKTHLEMNTESRVQDVIREANFKYLEYERMIDHNKKQLLEQWNNDRKKIIQSHKDEVKGLKDGFSNLLKEKIENLTSSYEEKIEFIENSYSSKLKTMNKNYSDEISQLKENSQKEIIQLKGMIDILKNEVSIAKSQILEMTQETSRLTEKFGIEIEDEKLKNKELASKLETSIGSKNKLQSEYEEKLKAITQSIQDRDRKLKIKFESEKNALVNHILNEKYEIESAYTKKISDLTSKFESLKEKYLKSKEKKSVVRINDPPAQRYSKEVTKEFSKEIQEKDKIINQLLKEKELLRASLDYMNSTVRIFSGQEKTVHVKSSSTDSKTPRSYTRTSKIIRNVIT